MEEFRTTFLSHSEEETKQFGKEFGEKLSHGDVVALYGELGAGKTEFVTGICEAFDVEEIVTSPTFSIINQYFGTDNRGDDITLYHLDLYRLHSKEELDEIGFTECIHSQNVIKIIEWAEHGKALLPAVHYSVHITIPETDESHRIIEIVEIKELSHV